MTTLSGGEIQQWMEGMPGDTERLVITPRPVIDEGAASVDLRLGSWFAVPRARRLPALDIVEERDDSTVVEPRLAKMFFVPFGRRFWLHPGSFALSATLEWIRLPRGISGYVVGRSSWGRRGLVIATAIGVHPSFTGCLTLELANLGVIPIALRPGMAIGQLFLHLIGTPTTKVEKSRFVGNRRPVMGELAMDEIARRLQTTPD